MTIAAGTKIGPYEIVGWLGAGGMGEVYRARDARLGRDVAIKLIPESLTTDPNRVRRFEQEARAAGQLNHPNILAVYDIGTHDGMPYIVSELLEGVSLHTRIQKGPLAPRKAIDYARQVAEGLAAAHDKGIVHRDLKPDNLFITTDDRIKILDFGIAKLTRPSDDAAPLTGLPTETETGMVVGTAGYMSPEQVRGEPVDPRSDLFSMGAVLHEMLTGRPAFARGSSADTMSAILRDEPQEPLPTTVPALARIVARCLEKPRERRFQSARDLAFGLEVLSDTATAAVSATAPAPRHWRTTLGVAVVVLSLLTAGVSWLSRSTPLPAVENPLANAKFTPFTDWEGTEALAEISPDGRFVAFLADKEKQFDIWLSQVGTEEFRNLTPNIPSLNPPGIVLRPHGFSGDGAEIWFSLSGEPGDRKMRMPLIGGAARVFLGEGDCTPSWSPDGTRLVYFNNKDGGGDPLFIADRNGSDARQILGPEEGVKHNHNPVWSPDGLWIYFVRGGAEPTNQMDVWRIRPSGGSPERLTTQRAAVNFLAPIDQRTLLYVARAEDRSGPWLWALDVPSKVTRRVTSDLDHYTSVSASRDGRRIVATVAHPTASLWTVPILDRIADDRDAQPHPVTTVPARAPRFGGTSLFYLSSRGTGDALWRFDAGRASEVWKGADRTLSDPPAVSPDGRRVALIVGQEGKRHLEVMSADGTNAQSLAPSLEIEGAPGAGTADWAPDSASIVTGGRDAEGPGLFRIPVDGGKPVRLVAGLAVNPIWSPDGRLILYANPFVAGAVELAGVRLDGTPVDLSQLRVRQGGYRFLPSGKGVVYLPRDQADFWLLDLATSAKRQLTHLSDHGRLQTFDIRADGKQIVFDRSRENSNIVLIELPK